MLVLDRFLTKRKKKKIEKRGSCSRAGGGGSGLARLTLHLNMRRERRVGMGYFNYVKCIGCRLETLDRHEGKGVRPTERCRS